MAVVARVLCGRGGVLFLFWSAFLTWSSLVGAAADWVLRGGTVYSLDASASDYSALAITGNRITWLLSLIHI